MEPLFRDYGGLKQFHGRVATVQVYEDNSLVRSALEQAGAGQVLVVDGGGSLRCALVGDRLAALAHKHGWAGIVVYGCIRDSVALGTIPVGVKALNTNPRKGVTKGAGRAGIALQIGGVTLNPGDHLYADEDGVLVARTALA